MSLRTATFTPNELRAMRDKFEIWKTITTDTDIYYTYNACCYFGWEFDDIFTEDEDCDQTYDMQKFEELCSDIRNLSSALIVSTNS